MHDFLRIYPLGAHVDQAANILSQDEHLMYMDCRTDDGARRVNL